MKTDILTEIICKKACSFYKAGKEDMQCGGYHYLADRFTLDDLQRLTDGYKKPASSHQNSQYVDGELQEMLCMRCEFRIDGCDFAENCSGLPCGGYLIMYSIIRS
jgi:hypothetical protein